MHILLGIALFYYGMERFLSQSVLAENANLAGLLAIVTLLLKFIIPMFDPLLFEFTSWEFAQRAEQDILYFLEFSCRADHCNMEILTSLLRRISQQMFSADQTLQLTATNPDQVKLECDLKISSVHRPCIDYRLTCLSTFFAPSRDSRALVVNDSRSDRAITQMMTRC